MRNGAPSTGAIEAYTRSMSQNHPEGKGHPGANKVAAVSHPAVNRRSKVTYGVSGWRFFYLPFVSSPGRVEDWRLAP